MDTIELVVGRIGKPHGIKGEVTVDVRTDEPALRYADGAVLRCEAPRGSAFTAKTVTVTRTRWHQMVLLVTFAEFHDRNTAEAARGVVLHATVPLDAVPEDPDEYYDHQLIGLAAVDSTSGEHLGEITGVVHGGAQDLLAIRATDGRPTLVPFVKALVPDVDLEARKVTVADRPGLVTALPEDDA